MLQGKVAEIRYERGYGFVKEALSGQLIRFNIGTNERDLNINDRIEFRVIDLDPGKEAFVIRKLG